MAGATRPPHLFDAVSTQTRANILTPERPLSTSPSFSLTRQALIDDAYRLHSRRSMNNWYQQYDSHGNSTSPTPYTESTHPHSMNPALNSNGMQSTRHSDAQGLLATYPFASTTPVTHGEWVFSWKGSNSGPQD
jgi:hypothetical protein